MTFVRLAVFLCAVAAVLASAAVSQAAPRTGPAQWNASSSTAIAITGDIKLRNDHIMLAGTTFPLHYVHDLDRSDVENAAKLFSTTVDVGARGAIYKTNISADAPLLNHNHLCAANFVTYIVLFKTPKPPTLSLAAFSGPEEPKLDPDVIAASPALCGTFTYTGTTSSPLPHTR